MSHFFKKWNNLRECFNEFFDDLPALAVNYNYPWKSCKSCGLKGHYDQCDQMAKLVFQCLA